MRAMWRKKFYLDDSGISTGKDATAAVIAVLQCILFPDWIATFLAKRIGHMLEDWSGFPSWYYHHDPTHVNFYSQKTMTWIAGEYGWQATFPTANVVLFRKE